MKQLETVYIMEESWDYLIVLDACRYDYFEKIYQKHLSGKLTCKKSVGSATIQWRNNSFSDFYEDIVYISSNPYINSIHPIKDFDSKSHFPLIIDVWATGWNPEIGTVYPHTVTKEALKAIKQYPKKRFIIHYLQPHAPYLGFGSDCVGFPMPDVQNEVVLQGIQDYYKIGFFRRKLFNLLYSLFKKFYTVNPRWFLAQSLLLPPFSPMDAVRRKYKAAGLRRAYEENLEIVLMELKNLLSFLKGTIVVTSDHGELLGENNAFSHYPGSSDPLLLNIPWLVIEKIEALSIPEFETCSADNSDVSSIQIEDRLRDLGYL